MGQCSQCGNDMRLIPAGISKKNGKPYNAFYACTECNHTERISVDDAPKATPNNANVLLEERVKALEEWRENIKNA